MIPFAPNFEFYLSNLDDVFCIEESRGTGPDFSYRMRAQEIKYSISLSGDKIGTYTVSHVGEGLVSLMYEGFIPGYQNNSQIELRYWPFENQEPKLTRKDLMGNILKVLEFAVHPKAHSIDQLFRADIYVDIPFP